MIFQLRDIRGRKLFERESPGEVLQWIRSRAVGFVEVWTLESSPGALIRIESIEDFGTRYGRPVAQKKAPGDRESHRGKNINDFNGQYTIF